MFFGGGNAKRNKPAPQKPQNKAAEKPVEKKPEPAPPVRKNNYLDPQDY